MKNQNIQNFHPPFFLKNKHIQTIVPSKFRLVSNVLYTRERITTSDNDFLDIDWSRYGSQKCAIIVHGMEGNTNRPYVTGMVKALNNDNWDCAALNLRGCSGEPNKKTKFYNAGISEDIDTVIQFINNEYTYSSIALVGFSLGGNILLKYLGEDTFTKPQNVCGSVTISVPCDLNASVKIIDLKKNRLYLHYFLNSFIKKIREKMVIMPDKISDHPMKGITSLQEYDNLFTAPLHGYDNAQSYYKSCSCKQFIPEIKKPSLLITAIDDPFLDENCFPHNEAKTNNNLYLLTPKHGGHVGFFGNSIEKMYWHEYQACTFLRKHCS